MIEILKDGDGGSLAVQIEQVKSFLFNEAEKVRYFENCKYIMLGKQVTFPEAEKMYIDLIQGRGELDLRLFAAKSLDMTDVYANTFGTTSFDMFSNYLCNLSLLIGLKELLDGGSTYRDLKEDPKRTKKHCKSKQEAIVPESVLLWRNKVAAHYALADQRKENLATLIQSVNAWPEYIDARYSVGGFKMSVDGEESELQHWGITEVYESLVPEVFDKPLSVSIYEKLKAQSMATGD
ncbi:hypothetical protein AYY26_12985 [Photobacterium phosphoreum]|uniref:hypothetical protein n=1 Tax=Photobacterium phosphoreum TaxID=659 RepID=UPI0007F95D72|nr:hypothetical protein [Photobacterium phosphoreum]OBU46948.1 hypothetical protein AYY26_12985 [Photobacterium phosphoreum]